MNLGNFVFSPARAAKTNVTPSKEGPDSNSENINPNPQALGQTVFNPRKNKLNLSEISPAEENETESGKHSPSLEGGNAAIKAKRLKKLAAQLPDIGGMEGRFGKK
jgi:hypothetical protein